MFAPYSNRLTAICDLLVSPQPDTVQEATDLLFNLWLEYSNNAGLCAEMKKLVQKYPYLVQEFTDRLERLSFAEDEKAVLLERITLLHPPKTSPEFPTREKEDKKNFDSGEPSNHTKPKIIDLFLASSSELKDDREQVEIWVNRENNRLVEKGFFLKLNLWEDFLDAMSETRLQDEYNKVVAKSDIVICLFATKVGKYTEEEFEVACANFKEKGKPKYIYTYFKVVQISTSDMNLDDLVSLQRFKEKLNVMGHFYTPYKSTEDLIRQLNNQLDKIFEEMP